MVDTYRIHAVGGKKIIDIPDGIRTRNLKIRSLTPYPLGHGDISCWNRTIRVGKNRRYKNIFSVKIYAA